MKRLADAAEKLFREAQDLTRGLDLDGDRQQLHRILCLEDRSTRYRVLGGKARVYWRLWQSLPPGGPLLCGRPFRQFHDDLLLSGDLGKGSAAIERLNEAIRLRPKAWRLYALRGRIRQVLSAWHEALADFERASRLNPRWPGSLWTGEVLVQLMRLDQGKKHLDLAVSRGGGPWAYAWRAEAKELLGDLEGARADRESALSASGASAPFLILRGKSDVRLEDLDAAVAKEPENVWAYIVRGHLRYHAKRYRDSIDDFSRVLALDPHCFWAHARLGQAWHRLGDPAAARRDWDRAFRFHHTWTWSMGFLNLAPQCEVYSRGAEIFMAAEDFQVLTGRLEEDSKNVWARSLRAMLISEPAARSREMLQAIADEPANPYLRALSAWITARFDPESGLRELAAALRLDPECGWFYARRGELRRRKGRLTEALADFNRCLKLAPGYWRAHLWTAYLLRDQKKYREALEPLNRYMELYPYPKDPNALLLRRELRWRRGDVEGALDDLQEAARLDYRTGWGRPLKELAGALKASPRNPRLLAWRAESALRLGRHPAARRDLDRALKASPKDAQALAWRGELKWRTADLKGALKDLDRSIGEDPLYPRAYAIRALVHEKLAKVQAAREDMEAFLALSPREVGSFSYMARLARLAGDSRQSADDLDRLLTLSPSSPWGRYERFQARRLLKDHAGAYRDFRLCTLNDSVQWIFGYPDAPLLTLKSGETALGDLTRELERSPDAWTYAWRGAVQLANGRTAEADADLARALALDPGCAWAYGWKAAARFGEGALAQAAEALETGLRLDPSAGWMRLLRARVKLKSPTPEDAGPDLDEALRLEPGAPEAHIYRAQLHERMGETREAKERLERGLELLGTMEWAEGFKPLLVQALTLQGKIKAREGSLQDALRDLRQAKALGSSGGGDGNR